MGSDPEADAHYRPRRRPLKEALAAAGFEVGEVGLVANCHLHFDHCGGNPELAGRPIFTQRIELATARSAENYTLPQLIEAPGLRYEELDGEAEVLDGVVIVPTPGHTAGHQSVVVHRPDGTVVVAGQTHDTASGFSGDALAWRARREARREGRATPLPVPPEWMDRLRQMDPRRVLFAHDHSVWEP